MSSLLWIDTETTALGDNAAVIEIALVPVINGVKYEPFVSYIRPHEGATIDPKAFEINGIDPKAIWGFPTAEEVTAKIIEFIDSHETVFSLAGHNVSFDSKHFFKLFCRTANYSNFVTRFSPADVCTLQLARRVFHGKRKKPSKFNLGELCKFFEIELVNAHSALPDIEATIKLYDCLCALVPNKERSSDTLSYQQKRSKYMAIDYVIMNPEGDCYINQKAMKDPQAMEFILGELWRITQQIGATEQVVQEKKQQSDWPEDAELG